MKEYRALGIPKEYDYTEILPLDNESLKWYNLNSEKQRKEKMREQNSIPKKRK